MRIQLPGVHMSGELAIGAFGRQAGAGSGGGGAGLLPFSDNFARADGAIGNGWTGATWTISDNKAINTPTEGSELAGNGDFSTGTGWGTDAGWSVGSGVATKVAGVANNLFRSLLTANRWYRTELKVNSVTGSFSTNGSGPNYSAPGTYAKTLRAGNNFAAISASSGSSAGEFDDFFNYELTLATLFLTRDFGAANVDASAKITFSASVPAQAGVVLNLDSALSPANFVLGYHDGTNAILVKCVGGTYTSLINTSATYSAGAALRVVKSGPTTYQIWYNGTQRGTDQTVSDAGIISNTRHGIFCTHAGSNLDDFSILAA